LPEWIEIVESRKFNSSGGRGQASRTFVASGYANPKALLASFGQQVITGSTEVAPLKGDSHSDFPGLIAKDFTATPTPGHTDLWQVEWTYEQITTSYLTAPAQPIEELPNEVAYVELSSEIRAEFVLEYRKDPDLPSRGIPEEVTEDGEQQDPEVDIAGAPIAPGGNPTSTIRRIQELTLTETVQGEPNFGKFGAFRFARNSAPFLGARPGRVLYRGASVRRTGVEVYQVSHTFIDDENFHLVQQPLVDQDGRPLLDEDRFPRLVYFVQPFEQMLDLNGISDNIANF
tara:strand:+ start:422 stop:1282 length:861 start_codon:yes stop_codon:yes gene_type:complete